MQYLADAALTWPRNPIEAYSSHIASQEVVISKKVLCYKVAPHQPVQTALPIVVPTHIEATTTGKEGQVIQQSSHRVRLDYSLTAIQYKLVKSIHYSFPVRVVENGYLLLGKVLCYPLGLRGLQGKGNGVYPCLLDKGPVV